MPSQRDNRDERLARLEALMELYRKKTETTRERSERLKKETRAVSKTAKAVIRHARKRTRK
jgi:hypothetical protein